MKFAKAGTLAAILALAAGGALAQAGGAASGAAGGAGTTGKVVGGTGDATVTANSIAPADGSNNLTQPGMEGMYNSMDDLRASRSWINGGYAVPYHVDTRVMGNTSARITHYYVDVPAGVRDEDDFRRWLSLR